MPRNVRRSSSYRINRQSRRRVRIARPVFRRTRRPPTRRSRVVRRGARR